MILLIVYFLANKFLPIITVMIIDGEELKYRCNKCGKKFKWIIGYGPVCPTLLLRAMSLKENPPFCPHCNSKDVKRAGLFGWLNLPF